MDLGCESELDGTEMAETNNNNGEENGGRCFNFSITGWEKNKYYLLNILMVYFLNSISNVFYLAELFLCDSLSFWPYKEIRNTKCLYLT